MNILVSGASIAGPALAFWLNRTGHRVTVVEKAPAIRDGGQAVDFRGSVHREVLTRMGILEDVHRNATDMGDLTVIDATGAEQATLPSAFLSGDVEILRGDLSHLLYDRTKDTAKYLFEDFITSLTDTPDGVAVTFDRAAPRTFDLVIGADGLHSGVRSLVFGEESQFNQFMGYYVAICTVDNDLGFDHTGVMYNEPGRGMSVSANRRDPDRLGVSFVFESDPLSYDRHDVAQQRKLVADRFAGMGWRAERFVRAMGTAGDFYFDAVSQIHMDSWYRGRVVLLGDAGYGATFGGMGTGLAVVCSYVLAGELAAANNDHEVAFANYARRIRKLTVECQKIAAGAGPFLAPATEAKIRSRNRGYRMLNLRPMAAFFNWLTTRAARAIDLPDYGI